ncbi:unnamed protein product, partial [Iphiclides podalirius]
MGESDIWDYFRKCDSEDGSKRARCLICEQSLSYASTSHNLRSHLARVHPDEVSLTVKPRLRATSRKNRSLIWLYFNKLRGADCVALCNVCKKPCSYKSTITNLRTHLARLHKPDYNEMLKIARERSNGNEEIYLEYVDGDEDSNQSAAAPDVWSFFEKETGGRARCVVCRATLPHRAHELRAHLKENHPKLAQDVGDHSENEEEEGSNETYTEVVYLEDEARKPPPRRESRPSSRPQRRPSMKRRVSSPSSGEDEQVEKFGTYITCLLKTIPREVCTRLQMDIVNLVMTTKLRTAASEGKVVLEGVGVPVTVQALPPGYLVTVPDSGAKQAADAKADPLNQEQEKACQDAA